MNLSSMTNRFEKIPLLMTALGGVLVLASLGCSHAVSQPSAAAAAPEKAPADPMEIQANDALMQRIKLGEPSYSEIGGSLTVAARVEVDETRIARVGSPVMGRITQLDVREGQEVTAGELLAVLNSTGLSDGQLSFLKAISQEQLAERAVSRAQQLLEAGVIGSAELRRREAELSQATAERAATRDELAVLGMPEDAIERLQTTRSINSTSRVVASRSGVVLERKVTVGQVIQPADTLAEIADLSSLWLVADVPEQAAGAIAPGQTVEAEIVARPGEIIRGKLSFVSATVNPETRTVRARMELANPRHKYKPAMLANMTVKDPTQKRQVVPVSAVVRDGGHENIFVQAGPNRFLLRPVTLGEQIGAQRVLLDGVRPGEHIVIDGAFHLNNERVRLSAQGV
jgi:cobalt-zinc-cadmium efflux system membrane fusion protein